MVAAWNDGAYRRSLADGGAPSLTRNSRGIVYEQAVAERVPELVFVQS